MVFYSCLRGWLLIVTIDISVSLLHPFNHVQIKLPSLNTLPDCTFLIHYLPKFVLSSSPSTSKDFTVMVIHFGRDQIVCYRSSDKRWMAIKGCNYLHITYHKGKFYTIVYDHHLRACDIISGDDPNNMTRLVLLLSHWPSRFLLSQSKYY